VNIVKAATADVLTPMEQSLVRALVAAIVKELRTATTEEKPAA
jgi:hypothetical protein